MGAEPETLSITIQKPLPVEQIPDPPSCPRLDERGTFSRDSMARYNAKSYLEKLEAWKVTADTIHAGNAEAIASNDRNGRILNDFLRSVGLTGHRERDYKSRARFPKYIDHPAGYTSDVARAYQKFDNYPSMIQRYESNKNEISRQLEKLESAHAQRAKDAELERKHSDSLIALGKMAAKYSVDVSDWSEMLWVLRKRCKYLDLACGMEATRCSWSDGPGKVRDAIERFTADTAQDKEIERCVLGCFDEFCDGRVFRDCEWNYGVLYGLVDAELLVDFRAAQENCPDWWE